MNVDTFAELWEAMRPHFAGGYDSAAEDFVTVLSDHGVELEDFREHISDSNLVKALAEYVEVNDEDIEDEFADFHAEDY